MGGTAFDASLPWIMHRNHVSANRFWWPESSEEDDYARSAHAMRTEPFLGQWDETVRGNGCGHFDIRSRVSDCLPPVACRWLTFERVETSDLSGSFQTLRSRRRGSWLTFSLGRQTDRLFYELPRNASRVYFGLVVVWLSVLLWAQPKGDWNTAIALGQLVAACISVVVSHARDWDVPTS